MTDRNGTRALITVTVSLINLLTEEKKKENKFPTQRKQKEHN